MSQVNISTLTGFGQLSDLPCLKLQYGNASAVVSLYGGQVLSYQPTPGQELLWLSDNAQWHNGAAIRGGVPVCWPWFGPASAKINPEQQPLPNHGLVRNRLWQIRHSESSAVSTSVNLSIVVNDLPESLWPADAKAHPVNLALSLILSANQLTMQLSCDTPLYQQAALHSYFRIQNLQQTTVTGLSQNYFDKVSNAEHDSPDDKACFSAETDRIYFKTGSQLHLADDKQQLTINQQGHDASVIWNPWQQKSRELPDMADHGFTEFVCVESARLGLAQPQNLYLIQTLIPH
ncbi:glucose-6-phosphate 1-epimerase [Arsukibacterium tuosuense]|uniref:Putative glucose-6-phosphate 1-epimerase n=1 Tax=Arsukibacterium tuosuense TaxID=1323745 RepID=A0A285I449_9GAMM|nr:D-hexose-6-phosphate mutarotase [Arsukibacterium tuosuense]SNY42729.1 glucose-6-phosphate 1-epimerase [Arsukibacterium tuosuense]